MRCFIFINHLACILAGATLLAATTLAQETITITRNGVVEIGSLGTWVEQDGYIEIIPDTSDEAGLFASRDLGTGDFQITAQLNLSELNATGAAFQLGSSYLGFDGPNQQLYLSGALAGNHHVVLGAARPHFEPEEWFTFEVTRTEGTIRFLINDQLIHSVGSFAGIGHFGFTFSPLGRVVPVTDGILRIQEFVGTGTFSPSGTINPGGFSIPLIDLAGETHRQVLVDREPDQYLGHPTTVLLEDQHTIITVYPKGHGRGAIVMKKSPDGGLTWSDRLPVPENWSTSQEVPTLYPVMDRDGTKRLIMFSGLYPIRMALSEDGGDTWSPLESIGDFGGIVAMGDLVQLRDGRYMAFFHDDGRFINGREEERGQFYVYKIVSSNGGLTWSQPEVVVTHPVAHLCEPGVIRSPDGQQLAMLLRENSRQFNSFVTFSDDEGITWSTPKEVTGALTGDRHQAIYGPDGRLFISFRDRTHVSPTWGDWVGWVGTYEDIVRGQEGQYRVRIMDNLEGADTAYPGVEILPDGTVVTTTYGHWTQNESPYIMSVRFTFEELDNKVAEN
jgi:hypothetical protein